MKLTKRLLLLKLKYVKLTQSKLGNNPELVGRLRKRMEERSSHER